MARSRHHPLDPFAVELGELELEPAAASAERMAEYDRLSPEVRLALDQAPVGVAIDGLDRCEQTLGTAAALQLVADTVREGLGNES